MNEIKIFSNEQFGEIRTAVTESGDPLFCLADLCNVLGLTPKTVNLRLSDEVVSKYPIIDSLGRTQEALFVNEDGMYDTILDSRKKEAKSFRKWVTSEVLPSIRKSGGYIMTKEEDSAEIIMARALFVAQEAMDRQKAKIIALEKEKENAQKVLEHQAPIVQYANKVLSSSSDHTATTIGAQFNMSAIILNRLLLKVKFIRRTGSEYSLCAPYQGKGLVETNTVTFPRKSTSEMGSRIELHYTEQGRMKIVEFIERANSAGFLKPVKGRLMIDKNWKKAESNA